VSRVDAVWLAVQPLDMRVGTEAALARVVGVFGAAHPNHAYLFANRRANRMKVLVHDGISTIDKQPFHFVLADLPAYEHRPG
jgi:transposase